MLNVTGLRVSYGRIEVLHGISFSAQVDQITCLIGPNGAGKTTTMWALSGIKPADAGQVRFGEHDCTGFSAPQMVRQGLALVPENRLIFPAMSVRENLRMGAFPRLRSDKTGVAQDLERVLGYFPRLKERVDQEAGVMSGGEQQMLAVARALMARPQLLMLDEPSIGLAPLVVAEIFDILGTLHKDGVGILLVEQNVQLALKLAHRVVALNLGEVAFDGSPQDFAGSEMMHETYLGRSSEESP